MRERDASCFISTCDEDGLYIKALEERREKREGREKKAQGKGDRERGGEYSFFFNKVRYWKDR